MLRNTGKKARKTAAAMLAGLCILASAGLVLNLGKSVSAAPFSETTPSPTPDRLAEPPLSESPTQYELGRHLYWYNCMPCHGDLGQGLTDEFRQLWPEDHQNCWGRGCHGGRLEDEGYPLPKAIPAIIVGSGGMSQFATAQTLFEFLKATHPPQNPGYLPDEEYWAVVDYLFVENGRLSPGGLVGPPAEEAEQEKLLAAAATGTLLLAAGGLGFWLYRRRKRKIDNDRIAE